MYILCMYRRLSRISSFECLLSLRFHWFINQYLNNIGARCSWGGEFVSEVTFLTVYLQNSYVRKALACAEQVQVNLSVTRGTIGRCTAVFVVTYHNRKKICILLQCLIEDSLVQSLGRSPSHSCLPRFHSALFVLAQTN